MPPEPNLPAPDFEVVPSSSPPGNGIAVMAAWLRRLARGDKTAAPPLRRKPPPSLLPKEDQEGAEKSAKS
jgi:hypothetical protein